MPLPWDGRPLEDDRPLVFELLADDSPLLLVLLEELRPDDDARDLGVSVPFPRLSLFDPSCLGPLGLSRLGLSRPLPFPPPPPPPLPPPPPTHPRLPERPEERVSCGHIGIAVRFRDSGD